MHKEVSPAIHYWGTPVVLVSTSNEDGSINVAPMSSAWWLGWSCMLGFDASSQTVKNLQRERDCVLNLATEETLSAVNRLARTTGSRAVPIHKKLLGYEHVSDKLERGALSTMPSVQVRAPRVGECLVQLEAEVVSIRPFAKADPRMSIPACAIEVRVVRAHVEESLLATEDRIDPEKWRPLLMSFRELFVMGRRAESSRLADGDESAYAPWKRGRLMNLAAKALGVFSEARHGVADDATPEM